MSDFFRGRRLRRSATIRRMVRETRVSVDALIYPMFVLPGSGGKEPIGSLPGQYRWTVDVLVEECRRLADLGIPAVLLFGIPEEKDARGSEASAAGGAVQRACAALKRALPELCVITDVCLCEYTSHGHCGIVSPDGEVCNDLTLHRLAEVAVSHAQAGADIIAPSDMMDGRVGAIRDALDAADFLNTPIMSYAAKYASAFYGPFREAAGSAPQFGDRRGYQLDPPNRREALRELAADADEGADILMVKPALAYLDIIADARAEFDVPIAAYHVSGEYSMLMAAAERGWLELERAVMEVLVAIKRAGADLILTYHAPDVAAWLARR
ncbi:MAG TPA: porphobilinogen synthase [Armatimonadota bacterium]|nr:porphobilinogen synthase [Armatimonadota bacterium]